ncbi:MAG: energy transducer TonB, partial [Gemmatimonadetes bacterium]|nr:energy transducer TonB [Gemmatimonadota bacterium]
DAQEYRRRYQVLQAYAREQESDSGWRSRVAIPRPIGLHYPDWLWRSRVEGSVLGQFIVDSTGKTRPASWHAIAVTHPAFEDAVVRSIPEWRWKPARNRGAPVCELTFDFIQFNRDGGVAQIWLATRL